MGANDFPFIRIWKLKVQSRVRNFLWMMAIKRLPTKDFLISWGVHLDTSICGCPCVIGRWKVQITFSLVTKKFMVDSDFGVMLDCVKPPPPGWMKFNVVGVALEDEVGCGGILRDDKGVACALFLGRIEAKRLEMVEIMAIKTTMHMYIGST
ncbi:hypothetical protein Godav_023029, partial [Gossypium davidsonii]|nr:hypothetical protein [Gossypium davidsonii]